jgi:hypothetical protein
VASSSRTSGARVVFLGQVGRTRIAQSEWLRPAIRRFITFLDRLWGDSEPLGFLANRVDARFAADEQVRPEQGPIPVNTRLPKSVLNEDRL